MIALLHSILSYVILLYRACGPVSAEPLDAYAAAIADRDYVLSIGTG